MLLPAIGMMITAGSAGAQDTVPALSGGGPEASAAGNPGGITADGPPRYGCATSASLVLPANALLVFARDRGD